MNTSRLIALDRRYLCGPSRLPGLQARASSRARLAPSLLAIDNVPSVFLPSGTGSGTIAIPISNHWSLDEHFSY